jgi:hypothetical protein
MIPLMIEVAYLAAACALLALVVRNFKAITFAGIVSTITAITAIVYIHVLNSDMRSWFSDSLSSALKDNPLAGLASAMVTSIQLKPEWGLYALCVLLGCVTALSFSKELQPEETQPVAPAAEEEELVDLSQPR